MGLWDVWRIENTAFGGPSKRATTVDRIRMRGHRNRFAPLHGHGFNTYSLFKQLIVSSCRLSGASQYIVKC